MDPSPREARLLARELEGLFAGLLSYRPCTGETLPEIERWLEAAVRADPRRELPGELVAELASNRRSPISSLVRDLAEILFLPREERTEYTSHEAAPKPWVFPKLMLEYALSATRLDTVVGGLLAPFCARHCPSPPVGCCHLLGYDMGLVPDGMLRMQELEARLRGWRLPPDPDREKCRYHTESGCVLRLFKTPACLQFVCEPMRDALRRDCGRQAAQSLVDALHELGACDIDRQKVFEKLALAVRAGEHCRQLRRRPAPGPASSR